MESKICSKCGKEKSLTNEYFYTTKNIKCGYRSKCRECMIEENKEYSLKNKVKRLEYGKIYYEDNKEWIKEKGKIYRAKNKEKRTIQMREYRNKNPSRTNTITQKRRSLKYKLPSTLNSKQWEQIQKDFGYKCAYCGMSGEEHYLKYNELMHQEHFIPLTKGGGYTLSNIIPACKSCNPSKGNKDFFEWYPKYKHYDKNREQFILEYLGYIKDIKQLAPFR